jgi:UDP-N-acetylglucosamine:LPS N-acetylglucosamine transferase
VTPLRTDFQDMSSEFPTPPLPTKLKVLAISSGGGHWVQLLRLRPAFQEWNVTYATVQQGYQSQVEGAPFRTVPDSNRWDKLSAIHSAFRIFLLLLELRPDVVITTGAAPGYFAIRFGRLFGAKTIWVDSIANAEELSLSGQMVQGKADLWLTQWPHLEKENGPFFRGNVL